MALQEDESMKFLQEPKILTQFSVKSLDFSP